MVFAIALVLAASTWFYVFRVLKPHQIAYATAHHQPRGNLSDLYPRWLGARELLLHRRNPYSREITLEIQRGYYGRALDPSNPDDPKDQQGFAYPAYVVFLLAPTITIPFDYVQIGFRWLLIVLTALTVPLWSRLLGWRLSCWGIAIAIVFTLGSLPVAQGIRLQQLTLLVAGLPAAAAACLAAGDLFWAGGLLALATIKPQLAWPLVIWLLIWAISEWRVRRRFVLGFAVVFSLLMIGAEILLPGWWRMFFEAMRQYHQYTQNQSVLEVLLGTILGRMLDVLAVAVCGFLLWRVRREPASGETFSRALVLVLALTVLVVPMFAPYNQVLLLPAILSFAHQAKPEESRRLDIHPIAGAGIAILLWPWLATFGLSIASFLTAPDRVQNLWALPFYLTFALPVVIFTMACLSVWSVSPRRLRPGAGSE